MRILLDKVFVRVLDPADKCFSKIAKDPSSYPQIPQIQEERLGRVISTVASGLSAVLVLIESA
jgi:hypothetical protein